MTPYDVAEKDKTMKTGTAVIKKSNLPECVKIGVEPDSGIQI